MVRSKIQHKKRFLFSVLAVFFLTTISVTIAYYSDTTIFNNAFHLGDTATYEEEFIPDDNWVPCAEVDKTATATNNNSTPRYVRMKLDEYWRLKNSTISDDDHTTTELPLTWTDDNDGVQHYAIINLQNEEDWALSADGWYYYKNALDQDETTSSLLKSVTLNCEANLVGDIVYSDDGKTGNSTPSPYADAKYHLHVTFQMSDEAFILEQNTITVNPNGGSYDGTTEPTIIAVNSGSYFTIENATRDGYSLDYWEVTSGDAGEAASEDGILLTDRIRVIDNITIVAHWSPAVARIERTQKLYSSINRAEAAAEAGDIITLLVDTEEAVVNGKTVTLDLNNHVVTGSLTNSASGNITLINGEINNPDGIAVTNNGALTIGINDFKEDGTVNIIRDNIRLIGTTTGIKQDGTFYFYDGFLEGDVGLEGGYNGAPYYRNTFDGVIVYYFPLVDHNNEKDCQHVELASADGAVSKTTVNGDIYYYNLQDNVNTSARTGYQIYAVRNFSATYPITVAADTEIKLDTVGYDILFSDTITNNGTFEIKDSNTTINQETGAITYDSNLTTPQTIINRGNLIIKNTRLGGTTNNDTIKNSGTLTMRNGTLSATTGYVFQTISGATYDLDSHSYIRSTSSNTAAVNNTLSSFTWDNDGNINASNIGVQNSASNNSFTIKRGSVYGGNTGISNNSVIIDGGTVGSARYGINASYVTLNNGTINVNANGTSYNAYGINYYYAATINGGAINVTKNNGYSIYGINGYRGTLTINNGTITVNNNSNGTAYGIYSDYQSYTDNTVNVNNGTIYAHSTNGNANGIYMYNHSPTFGNHYLNIYNGTISGISDSNTGNGLNASNCTVRNGKIIGSTYGIYLRSTEFITTVGTDGGGINIESPEIIGNSYGIYGGSVNFYDGVLRGNVKAAQAGSIKAVPDATTLNIEQSDEYAENCWLIDSANYLKVGDDEFNSLSKAYNAITGDTGTIQVIADATVEAVLPGSPANKTITFDLNGHTLTYTQTLANNGIMTIVDSSEEKTGKLINISTIAAVITNNKELTIESGYISSAYRAITQNAGAKLTINGGTIQSSNIGIHSESYNSNAPVTITINGGLISATQTGISSSSTNIYMYGGKILVRGTYGATGVSSANMTIDVGDENTAIDVSTPGEGSVSGFSGSTLNLRSGIIQVAHPGWYNYNSTAVYGTINMSGGKIIATAGANSMTGIQGRGTITGGEIIVSSSNNAIGVSTTRYDSVNISNATITVTGTSSSSYASGIVIGDYNAGCNFYSGILTVSSQANAYGINVQNDDDNWVNIYGGSITAITTGSNYKGYGISTDRGNIQGGKIYGSNYGVYNKGTYNNVNTTIGNNNGTLNIESPEIAGGEYGVYGATSSSAVYFYDGVLRGKTKAYSAGVIKAIPDATTYHIESSDDYTENCWLEDAADYLRVGETEYNSLSKAYNAITEDTGTIQVIKDASIEAVLPASPANKTITFDLNGHTLNYTQTLTNNSNMIIVDSSEEKTGRLNNTNRQIATIVNNKNLTIESGYIYGINRAIYMSTAGATLTINGGTLYGADTTIYCDGSTATTITMNGGTISGSRLGISGNGYTEIYLYGGKISISGENATGISSAKNVLIDAGDENTIVDIYSWGEYDTRGIAAATTLRSGTIQVRHPDWGRYSTVGIQGVTTMSGGKIIVSGYPSSYGISSYGPHNITGGEITVTSTTSSAFGISNTSDKAINISNTVITVNGEDSALGINLSRGSWSSSSLNLNSGTINVHSNTRESYGVRVDDTSDVYMTINGGTINATSRDSIAYGVYSPRGNINGGEIYSQNYGVYNRSSSEYITIGSNNGTIITSPSITGGQYGLYNGQFNFYDGILRGGIAAYQEGVVKAVASNSTIYITTETIDEVEYDTRYLIDEYDVAQIGETKYKKLTAAIAAAEENDVIELIADNYIFDTPTIPAGKIFTIETNGYGIYTGNPITNNGSVVIQNSQYITQNPTHKYRGTGYFITNNAGATLTLKNISLEANNVFLNYGDATIDNTKIYASETGINNQNTLAVTNNISTTGWSNAIYNTGTLMTFSGGAINGDIYNQSGNLTVANATARKSGTNIFSYITNNATLTFDNTDALLVNDKLYNRDINNSRMVYNSGAVTIANNSILTHELKQSIEETVYVIYSDNTVLVQDSSITLNNSQATYNSYNTYGIYSPGGNITVESGSVRSASRSNSYGIYTDSGTIVLGIPEPTTSPNYGRDTANVSTTSPDIYTIANNTGYGVYYNTGKVRFYDGKVTGSTNSFSKAPTNTEYLYEAHTYTDENNYPYTILEWIREQPSGN